MHPEHSRRRSVLADVWQGHVLMFERPLRALPGAVAWHLLLTFVVTGGGLLWAGRLSLPAILEWTPLAAKLIVASGLALGSVLISAVTAAARWDQIGLKRLSTWTRREVLYALQVVPTAAVVFYLLFRTDIDALISANGVMSFTVFHLAFGLCWGFYQEFTYRGLLQRALSSRIGTWSGVLVANLIFTIGPLHASIWTEAATDPQRLWLFVPIFGIGLFLGALYQRSGNLWLPAVFHGLWPPNLL